MKKILAIAAVAALTAGVSAYAANPFSDVSTSDWAYQAVSDLSDQGIVEGYPDGTFKGQQNMTRYELAQIIARLMAKEDQLNAEQRAIVDKLASQFADELANLGVRVGNIEKKLGNVSWKGDARIQFQHADTNEYKVPKTIESPKMVTPEEAKKAPKAILNGDLEKQFNSKEDSYGARVRLKADAKVNDQVTVKARLTGKLDFMTGAGAEVKMDQLHVVYAPTEAFNVDIGRTAVSFGTDAIYYDDFFNGVIANMNLGAVDLQAGYGRAVGFDFGNDEFAFAQASAGLGEVATVGGFYGQVLKKDAPKFWGVSAGVKLGDLFTVNGDYITNEVKNAEGKTPKLWNAGVTLGEADGDQVGSFSVGVRYVDADAGSYYGASGLDLDFLALANKDGGKFWVAKAAVIPMKGVELDAYYNFQAKDKTKAERDLGNAWGVELNYAF